MPIESKQKLALLQIALMGEYRQWDLYIAYMSRLKGIWRGPVADEFEIHADEEEQHIQIIQRYIVNMGETPTNKRHLIPELPSNASIAQIIELQLKFEKEAVEIYRKILTVLDDTDPLKIEIENILAKEQEHVHDLELLQIEKKDTGMVISAVRDIVLVRKIMNKLDIKSVNGSIYKRDYDKLEKRLAAKVTDTHLIWYDTKTRKVIAKMELTQLDIKKQLAKMGLQVVNGNYIKKVDLDKVLNVAISSDPHQFKQVPFGYNSYGHAWTKISELKNLEVEDRGNQWFDDSKLDLEKTLGVWVTIDPRDALFYLFSPGFRDAVSEEGFLNDEYQEDLEDEWDDFERAIKHPLDFVTKVDLAGAIPVVEHHEEFGKSYLYIKPVYKEKP